MKFLGRPGEARKHLMVLNLVETRHPQLPLHLDVGRIVSGYTLEAGVSILGLARWIACVAGFLAESASAARLEIVQPSPIRR